MAALTDMGLKAKTAADVGTRVSDGGSLFGNIRIDRAGRPVVAFEFRFRSPATGKHRAIACGIWPDVTLKAIRKQRDEYRVAVDSGVDPLETKKARKLAAQADLAEAVGREQERLNEIAASQARITVTELFKRWEKTELVDRKDHGAEVRRMFEKDVFPTIGDMAAEDVRKGHVMSVVDKVKLRGASRMARVVFSLIRQMMRFAVDRDLLESDPTAAIRKEKAVGKDEERDRILSEDEIKQLAIKLPGARLTESVKAAVWIMLSTLCRVGELSMSKWADLDLEAKKWRIPAEVAKNKKEHRITLSDFAVSQFEILEKSLTSKVWIFPSRDGRKHLDEKTITKQLRDRQRTEQLKGRAKPTCVLLLSGGQWTSHDLRRTGATLMGELGVAGETIERCLNHIEQNRIKRIYQRQRNEQAMTEAWQLLGERLDLLVNGDSSVIAKKNSRNRKTAAHRLR